MRAIFRASFAARAEPVQLQWQNLWVKWNTHGGRYTTWHRLNRGRICCARSGPDTHPRTPSIARLIYRLRPRAPCEDSVRSGQAPTATESNNIQSNLISGRTPPLSHPLVERLPMPVWSVGSCARTPPPQWSRGLFVRNALISEAEAATHSLHIVPPPDDQGGHAAAGGVRRLLFLARTLARGSLIEMIFVP
jgi:hypothetical protein